MASNAFDNMVQKQQRTVPKKAFSRLTSGKKASPTKSAMAKSRRTNRNGENAISGYVAMSA